MIHETQLLPQAERLRSVSVPKAVAAFLVAGLVVLTAVGLVLALALHQTATNEAIREARLVTELEATSVVGQVLTDEALVPGPAYDKLDQVVRQHVISHQIVRIKVWDASGRIVYSDDKSLVGLRFPLGAEDLAALESGGAFADLLEAENFHWNEDVLKRRQAWDQVKRLENKADLLAPNTCQAVLAHCRDLVVVNKNTAGARCVESGYQPEQRRFTAARRTGDRDELPVGNIERNIVEYRKILNAGTDGFCDVFELDHRSSLPQIFTAETLRRRKNQGKSPIGAYLA